MNGNDQTDLVALIDRERQLAAALDQARHRLGRLDDEVDEEDRAEMYAILQALHHDVQFSGECLAALLSSREGEAPRARA